VEVKQPRHVSLWASERNQGGGALLRIVLAITLVLLAVATMQIADQAYPAKPWLVSYRWAVVLSLSAMGTLLCLVSLILSWTSHWQPVRRWFLAGLSFLQRQPFVNILLLVFLLSGYGYNVLGPWGRYLTSYPLRLCLFWVAGLVGSVCWVALTSRANHESFDIVHTEGTKRWITTMAISYLVLGVGYRIAVFLPAVSTYPFSLDWSEASRYYYASLFFGERLYGVRTTPSALHPSRYLLQAIPFLVSGLPLWVHRLWQVLLWIGMTFGTGFLLARQVFSPPWRASVQPGLPISLVKVLFIGWAFLFLLQGPVYYHLQVCVLLVLWSYDRHHPIRSTLGVLLASAWAGISRLNWYPMPAMLASVLYFLETPLGLEDKSPKTFLPTAAPLRSFSYQTIGRYLLKPLWWTVCGVATAFLAQAVYVHWAGIDVRWLSSSFTSDLLWYRLLPNATFPLGVLPVILLISAPLLGLVAWNLRSIHWVRALGIGGILAVFFIGGLIVSTKIGGGSNLHNLDAFLVLVLVVGAYGWSGRLRREDEFEPLPNALATHFYPSWLLLPILAIPILYAIGQGSPLTLPKRERTEKALAALRELTAQVAVQGGEVLLISQRHLLTFGYLPDVALVEPYENVFLMEMVMAGNSAYLQPFYEDLRQKRFALIVSDPQPSRLKGRAFPFGEENDVWLQRVTQPLMASYKRIESFKEIGMEIYVPKP
jgi:hypothetical protein